MDDHSRPQRDAGPTTPPSVGVFWVILDGAGEMTLVSDGTPLAEG